MKQILTAFILFFSITLINAQLQIDDYGIGVYPDFIEEVDWTGNFDFPPYFEGYEGDGTCKYDAEKHLTEPYEYQCNPSVAGGSHYWMRVWAGDGVTCYDAEGEGGPLLDCQFGTLLKIAIPAQTGFYLQMDLYSQCTENTGGNDTGSYWSTYDQDINGTTDGAGWIPPSVVNSLNNLGQWDCHILDCVSLVFAGSPDCECPSPGNNYGCGSNDSN